MRIRKENGLAGIDIVIAVIAITIFSALIISMMYSNVVENVKLKKETLAMIFITEIFENVGIEDYENLTVGNYEDIGSGNYEEVITDLVPQDALNNFQVDLVVTDELENVIDNDDIIKKLQVTLSYEIDDKVYACSMQRMKAKE